jgi:hypothetical protein
MSEHIEFTDRYQALGIPHPDAETMCPGQCEGIGRYPVWSGDDGMPMTDYEREQWELEEKKNPLGRGATHFIVCGDCQGTGKRKRP